MKKKTSIKIFVPTAITAFLIGFFVVAMRKTTAPEYQTEVLAKGDIETLVSTSGTISPIDTIDVGSQVSGKIIKLYADFNSGVKAGQVVAELDQNSLQANVDSERANYQSSLAAFEKAKVDQDLTRKKYDRTTGLYKLKLVSPEDMETVEADLVAANVAARIAENGVSQAKAELDTSRANLSYAIIRTPIDGTVITRSVNIGQTVAAGYETPVLFKIASNLAKMQVQCSVDEADIGRIKEGQKARFTVSAFPDESFIGTLRQVRYSSATTQNIVTYTVIIDADNPDLLLRPGMTASVSIIVGEARDALLVPNSALRFTPEKPSPEQAKLLSDLRRFLKPGDKIVWIMDEMGLLKPRSISIGVTGKSTSELGSGDIKVGQKIVTGLKSATTTISTQDMPPMPFPDGGPPPPPPIK